MKKVYYTDPTTSKTQQYLLEDIDANDAVRRFPDQYSFTAPAAADVEVVKNVFTAMAAGEPLPPPPADPASPATAPVASAPAAAIDPATAPVAAAATVPTTAAAKS